MDPSKEHCVGRSKNDEKMEIAKTGLIKYRSKRFLSGQKAQSLYVTISEPKLDRRFLLLARGFLILFLSESATYCGRKETFGGLKLGPSCRGPAERFSLYEEANLNLFALCVKDGGWKVLPFFCHLSSQQIMRLPSYEISLRHGCVCTVCV